MHHAARDVQEPPSREGSGGFAMWMMLYAVAMVAFLTLLGGANLLGDRFSPSAATTRNVSASD